MAWPGFRLNAFGPLPGFFRIDGSFAQRFPQGADSRQA